MKANAQNQQNGQSPYLKQVVIQVVDKQIAENNPPATKATYERLKKRGYTPKQAKEKIAAVLLGELYDMLSDNTPFDEGRYAAALSALK